MTGLLFNFNKVLAGIKQRKYYIMNGFHAKNKGAEMYMKLIKMLWWKNLATPLLTGTEASFSVDRCVTSHEKP